MFQNNDPLYLDVACTTPTLKVATDTYTKFAGTCLGRSDYPLAVEANQLALEARKLVKQWFDIHESQINDWQVVFGYNTTDLINKFRLALEQDFTINSGIGHNSVSLQRGVTVNHNIAKNIITLYSNIDGLEIKDESLSINNPFSSNLAICDLAQGFFSHNSGFEANKIIIFSGHKIYSTHLGVALVHKDLLNSLEPPFIGGGTIFDSNGRDYTFYNGDERYKAFEAGLPDTGSICALGKTIKHLIEINAKEKYKELGKYTREIKDLLLSKGYQIATSDIEKDSTLVSFFDPKDTLAVFDIAEKLVKYGIKCRAGSCCAESWLIANNFPQVVRLSLGLNYTKHEMVLKILNKVL